MSEFKAHAGMLKKITLPRKKTFGVFAKEMIFKIDGKLPDGNIDLFDYLLDIHQDKFFYHEEENTLYEIKNEEFDPMEYQATAMRMNEDLIVYDVRYYSGGCNFEEALTDALNKM